MLFEFLCPCHVHVSHEKYVSSWQPVSGLFPEELYQVTENKFVRKCASNIYHPYLWNLYKQWPWHPRSVFFTRRFYRTLKFLLRLVGFSLSREQRQIDNPPILASGLQCKWTIFHKKRGNFYTDHQCYRTAQFLLSALRSKSDILVQCFPTRVLYKPRAPPDVARGFLSKEAMVD